MALLLQWMAQQGLGTDPSTLNIGQHLQFRNWVQGGGAQGAGMRSVLSYLRGEEPMPSWGGQQVGQFQVPGGANYGDVPLPGSVNLTEFLQLPYEMQQMYLSALEATYSMTPQTAGQWMGYFAPRGIASPVAVWG